MIDKKHKIWYIIDTKGKEIKPNETCYCQCRACVIEVVVKVVKKDYDECMQERADYIAKCAEQAEKKAEREKAAAEKKAKAEAKKTEKEKKAE